MSADAESIRREASILARRKTARNVFFSRESPSDWRPHTVTNPEDSQPYTDAAAWELIATLLFQGEPLEAMELDHPPGRTGYVMVPCIAGQKVYIKFQLGAGKILAGAFTTALTLDLTTFPTTHSAMNPQYPNRLTPVFEDTSLSCPSCGHGIVHTTYIDA